jgi:aminoglycoside phosphotransferase (APT) family kinase protein
MSSETLLFTARWVEGGASIDRRLVARIEPPADAHPVFTHYDLGMQHRVMELVAEYMRFRCPRFCGTSLTSQCSGAPSS